ncbi:putative U3 small nucleolar RNA-associated protein 5 [Blattamonas nauphoetae]|uniref:U3 small nucleolar RNA-associated protein 5 n=1 Tax=Blattamonas nauphoetae TaxID=2049346 RepID=A0ABQ9XGZ1_9EUKA|nr:putative U3 small nucleolar RNA-associated protein 5 [Blattamonas nauphoetae]
MSLAGFSPDNSLFVVITPDNRIKLWECKENPSPKEYTERRHVALGYSSLNWAVKDNSSAESKSIDIQLLLGHSDGSFAVCHIVDGRFVSYGDGEVTKPIQSPVVGVFTTDKGSILSVHMNGEVAVYNIETRAIIHQFSVFPNEHRVASLLLTQPQMICSAALSPDSSSLLVSFAHTSTSSNVQSSDGLHNQHHIELWSIPDPSTGAKPKHVKSFTTSNPQPSINLTWIDAATQCFAASPLFSFDSLETTSLPFSREIVGINSLLGLAQSAHQIFSVNIWVGQPEPIHSIVVSQPSFAIKCFVSPRLSNLILCVHSLNAEASLFSLPKTSTSSLPKPTPITTFDPSSVDENGDAHALPSSLSANSTEQRDLQLKREANLSALNIYAQGGKSKHGKRVKSSSRFTRMRVNEGTIGVGTRTGGGITGGLFGVTFQSSTELRCAVGTLMKIDFRSAKIERNDKEEIVTSGIVLQLPAPKPKDDVQQLGIIREELEATAVSAVPTVQYQAQKADVLTQLPVVQTGMHSSTGQAVVLSQALLGSNMKTLNQIFQETDTTKIIATLSALPSELAPLLAQVLAARISLTHDRQGPVKISRGQVFSASLWIRLLISIHGGVLKTSQAAKQTFALLGRSITTRTEFYPSFVRIKGQTDFLMAKMVQKSHMEDEKTVRTEDKTSTFVYEDIDTNLVKTGWKTNDSDDSEDSDKAESRNGAEESFDSNPEPDDPLANLQDDEEENDGFIALSQSEDD